jgi:hypothetical protein
MKTFFALLLFLVSAATICHAEVYEYTDKDGVVHFTDDLSRVPASKRKSRNTPSLSSSEAKTVETIMKLENKRGQDIPVNDMPTFKKNVKQFGESFKDELGDPAEPKNSRLSTPEGAWNLFIEGLKSGNLNYIKSSLIGKQWENGGYKELNKPQLAEFGRELANITIIDKKQDDNSAVFNIKNNKSGHNDTIRFIKFIDNWKIYEL